jgi:amino acid transporter
MRNANRTLRRTLPFLILSVGLLVFTCGFLYSAIVVGIPYQEPPPDLLQRYNEQAAFARNIQQAGGLITLGGVAALIVQAILRLGRRR